MKPKSICLVLSLVAALTLAGCHPQHVTARKQATVYRLFDLFQLEDLSGKVNPEDVEWKRYEFRPQDMAAWVPPLSNAETNTPKVSAGTQVALRFHALTNIADLRLEQGLLTGKISGAAPVLHFALRENRGGAEPVKVIEVRMKASGAKQVWLRPEGSSNLEETNVLEWASQTNKWDTALDVEDGKTNTYRFELKPGQNGAPNDLRHFFITFREAPSAQFAIESIRLVSEREERLKEASGQQWAGLSEIYHASLAAKTPEIIKMPLRDLPSGAALKMAIGTREDYPVKFKVSASTRDGGKESAPAVVFERTVTIPNRWQPVRIDLAAYAGKSVLLELAVSGATKGLWGFWGSPVIRSYPAATALASANGKRKPRGVILLVIDTLRKDHLNIYGYPRETVINLKKFADEGVAFRHAISQGTWTKVSVPSIVTSLYPLTTGVLDMEHALPASAKTLAEVFREEGYSTVSYSSVPFTGKMNNMHQGYDELHESSSVSDKEYQSKNARHYVDRAINWLEQHGDEPFFVFLHVFDPHSPFRPRPPYDTLWGAADAKDRMTKFDADISKHKVANKFGLPHKDEYIAKTGNDPDELLKIYMDWYDGSIRGMDADVGRLLEALRTMGLEQDTLMVWATDHGEEFWEHNELFHGQSVYGELNQVPMVYRWPNSPDVRKGAMVDQQVQNLDIMPTILELAGIPGPTNMQGRSLVTLLNGGALSTWQEQPAFTETLADGPGDAKNKPHFGVVDHGWKLVRKEFEPEQEELFEHPSDHLNLTNVIKNSDAPTHVKSLKEQLESWKARATSARLPSDESTMQQMSSEEVRRLRALGYVGGTSPTKPAANTMTNTAPNSSTNKVPAAGSTSKDTTHP